jgi:hypothetical protein
MLPAASSARAHPAVASDLIVVILLALRIELAVASAFTPHRAGGRALCLLLAPQKSLRVEPGRRQRRG